MATPPRARAATASPGSRTPLNDQQHPKRSHNSPYRHSPHRSSPQVLVEELGNLRFQEGRAFIQRQEERDAEQQRLHQQALAQAAAEHERIRQGAIWAAEKEELEKERERKQKEEEELRALEAERIAKAERDAAERRRVKEELERQEQEQRRRAAEEKEIQERQSRLAEQKRKDEADAARRKQEQEEADQKARDEAANAAAAAAKAAAQPVGSTQPSQPPATTIQSQPQPSLPSTAPPTGPTAVQPTTQPVNQPTEKPAAPALAQNSTVSTTKESALTSTTAEREVLHAKYLAIHEKLKTMRKQVIAQCKNTSYLKDIGDWRRKLQTLLGQFTPDRINNRTVLQKVLALLSDIQKFKEPTIDISPLLVSAPADGIERRMSAPLVYLLNILAKKVLTQFLNENTKIADAVSIVIATAFSKPEFKFDGTISLIDILLAKYHKICPVLFGISGDEKTRAGKIKIGWQFDQDGGYFVSAEAHKQRMVGLAFGFGCLSLRDFSKSKMENPFPPTNYWRSLSYIANTPSDQLQETHFIILKALVEGHIERFLKFYGYAGIAALRKALVELPKNAPQGAARDSVVVFPQTLQKEMRLTL